jgi:hypothetical protein
MRTAVHVTAALVTLSFSGCSYFFYPKADHYLTQAKGTTGVQTIENLTTMLEASSKAALGTMTYQAAVLKRLWKQRHDQGMQVAHLDLFVKRLQELRETVRLL